MLYSDVAEFLAAGLRSSYDPLPAFSPGPASSTKQQKTSSGRLIFVTVGGGAGLTTELLFDRPFISIRVCGNQNDYADAETLAKAVDFLLLGVDTNSLIGAAEVLYVTRTGGGPSLLEQDSADRYHFSCSYISETQTGL
jgi:hypothetical protein